jgi:hypothetical protein
MPSEIIYSVFVSSTYEDLREERAAVQKSLLQLHCMPIGMELFGSADEETWDFIKRQIEQCDYYVVIVADKYGSIADDGVSYTEKEYDYARETKKPVLAFVHNDRGSIPRNKTETDPEKRPKLEAFITKVKRSPVSFFTTPHELATQVTVSFVNQRERRPAVGFIRADQAPDLKKYADLLEENARLKADLARFESGAVASFPHASEIVNITVKRHMRRGMSREGTHQASLTWGEIFVGMAEDILSDRMIGSGVREKIFEGMPEDQVWLLEDGEVKQFCRRLYGIGLLRNIGEGAWDLTDYGQKQYGLLMS